MKTPSALFVVGLLFGCPAAEEKPVADPGEVKNPPPPIANATQQEQEHEHEHDDEKPEVPKPPPTVTPPSAPPHDAPLLPNTRPVEVLGKAADCPPLPSRGLRPQQLAAQKLIAPLRALSCKPGLMGKPLAEIVSATSAPAELELRVGTHYAGVEPGSVLVTDLAAAAGIEAPKLRLNQGMSPSWTVVADGEDAPPLLWGVARLVIRARAARYQDGEDGMTKPIEADAKANAVQIVFDDDVLRYGPDPLAAKAVASALLALAEDLELLERGANAVREGLPVLAERYSVSAYSVGAGADKRVGVDIHPQRTELRAVDLTEALGFPANVVKPTNIGSRHSNGNRLEAGGEISIPWRGLVLEITLGRDGDGIGLLPWTVRRINVLPPEIVPAP